MRIVIVFHCTDRKEFSGLRNRSIQPIFKTEIVISQSETNLDCVQTMPAHFENGEKCDGSEI